VNINRAAYQLMEPIKEEELEPIKQHLPFGKLLKFWRSVYELSQESLAFDLGSSPRHISFLENGKAHPSKEMVLKLAAQLSLGETNTNQFLISAGYTDSIHNVDFHTESPKWLRKAMMLTLRAMDPYPATLMDSSGKILMVNKAWVSIFSLNISKQQLDLVDNHFDFIFSRKGAGNIISSRQDTMSVILVTLTQAAILQNDKTALKTVERLAAHPDVPKDWRKRGAAIEPMASYRIQLNINGALRRFYNVTQSVNAAGSIAYAAKPLVTINTLYPEDDNFNVSELMNKDVSHPLLFY